MCIIVLLLMYKVNNNNSSIQAVSIYILGTTKSKILLYVILFIIYFNTMLYLENGDSNFTLSIIGLIT